MKAARDPYLTRFYVHMRSWGGLVSLGLNVFLAWLAWWLAAHFNTLLPPPRPLSVAQAGACFFSAIALLNYPFDYLFGHLLERHEGRSKQTLLSWHAHWLAGSLVLAGAQTLGLLLLAVWLLGERGQWIGMLGLPLVLVAAKAFQFYWIPPNLRSPAEWKPDYRRKVETELKRLGVPLPPLLFLYRSADGGSLNGGHVGLGPWCRLMVSDTAQEALEPRELAVLLAREIADLEAGATYRSLMAVFAACTLGLLLGLVTSVAFTPQGWPQLAWMAAFASTWLVASLPVFVWYSRRCVFAADARLLRLGVGKPELRSILRRVQQYNWTQWGSQDINIKLFAGMPAMQDRLEHLEREA